MSDELDLFMVALTTVLAAMTDITQAPEHPPENINDPPMVVSYFVSGRFEYSLGRGAIGHHTGHSDVLLARSVLPHDEEKARPYILRGLAAFAANVKMDGTCEHCLLTNYEGPGAVSGYATPTFGVRYIWQVKIKHANITISV